MSEQLNPNSFREMVRRRFKNSGAIVDGTFELTGRCNLNCKMCYIHTHPNGYFAQGEQDGNWWIALIDEACKAGMMFALLTGGECLLHPDFCRIYRHLRQQGVYTSINTNGLLLTQEMIDFLIEDPPFELQMTLYGTSEDAYEQLTGARAFYMAESAIQRLKASGLNFRIAVTPSSYAPGETERIISYLKEQGVPYVVSGALFTPHKENIHRTVSEKDIEIEERIRYLRLQMKESGPIVPLENLPPAGGNQLEPVYGLKCSGGIVSCFITWDGHMQACNSFYNQRVPVSGPEDFLPAWGKIREQAQSYLMPIECEGCIYRKICLSCPTARSGKVGNGHCDPAICDMTRRLVSAGVKKLPAKE